MWVWNCDEEAGVAYAMCCVIVMSDVENDVVWWCDAAMWNVVVRNMPL